MTVPLITFETANAGLVNLAIKQVYHYEHASIVEYFRMVSIEEQGQHSLSPILTSVLDKRLLKGDGKDGWSREDLERVGREGSKDEDTEEEEEEEESEEEVEYIEEGDRRVQDRIRAKVGGLKFIL